MPRKRSRDIKLAFLGAASLLVSGCGGCEKEQHGGAPPPAIDQKLAKQAVAAGTGVVVSDAFLQAAGMIASSSLGGTAPLDVAKLGYIIDLADETADVTSNESGLPRTGSQPGQQGQPVRHVYHYYHSPGIGWFLWGHMLGSSTARAGQPYTPPRSYGATPRTYTPGSSFAGGSSGSRSGTTSSSGGVSRGGFGSSGTAHASGGTS